MAAIKDCLHPHLLPVTENVAVDIFLITGTAERAADVVGDHGQT